MRLVLAADSSCVIKPQHKVYKESYLKLPCIYCAQKLDTFPAEVHPLTLL